MYIFASAVLLSNQYVTNNCSVEESNECSYEVNKAYIFNPRNICVLQKRKINTDCR